MIEGNPYVNPFPPGDADRSAIWRMLVERDIEAFVARSWEAIDGDFIAEGFFGIDAGRRDRPDSWRLAFPNLATYRDAWLRQAEEMAVRASPEEIRAGLASATLLRDIEVAGDTAVAHKKFDGEVQLRDGTSQTLRWQTLYHCRRFAGAWKIAGFVGYLPNPMGSGAAVVPPKRLPPSASQHRTAGPYSPVLQIVADELVVISGQAAIAEDGSVVGQDVATQTSVTLDNCERQLVSAGCTLADVFKVNVYLTDLSAWTDFNEVYARRMPEPRPVRTAVQAALLPGLLVEVEMWAAPGRSTR